MNVPFLDLTAQYRPIRAEIDEAVRAAFDANAFILGAAVDRFEEAFAEYVGAGHCVGVNSGTSALHLALLAAGVGPGDDVVTTPHTWVSTSWAISYCGARPVFADVDPATGNLDPEAAEGAITPATKALLPVDLYGNPADLEAFRAIGDRHGLALVDDAAQAAGTWLRGRPVGSFGDFTCFSFYPGKNLGAAGEAGAVVTDDADAAARIRRLRDHAQDGRHNHVEIGFNYRMEGLQGAVLGVKLPHLDAWNGNRRKAASRYGDLLGELAGVTLPVVTDGAVPSWHLYPIRVEDRDAVLARLAAAGIGAGAHYPKPVHLQPAYASLGHQPGDFPNAETYAATCRSLPMFAEITGEQQEAVAEALFGALGA